MPRFGSTKRPTALEDADYDHEIALIDHTSASLGRARSLSASDGEQSRGRDSLAPDDVDDARRHSSESPLRTRSTRQSMLRDEIARRKYGKYSTFDEMVQKQPELAPGPVAAPPAAGTDTGGETDTQAHEEGNEGDGGSRPMTPRSLKQKRREERERETAIDILYENQRGGFLCGLALFSSKALGSADAPPWTNVAQKPSLTDTQTAQVPDPSWEWVWKEWVVNHQDDVDEDGWQYSFCYAKACSWHGPRWFNSFVRRRAWIRKRMRKHVHRSEMEAHRLNSDYFTIHPTRTRSRSRSPSKAPSMVESRLSTHTEAIIPVEREDIRDIGALMTALKESRIDREKTEAIENFIVNGGDDLIYLSERMHDIMGQFIFQASRRSLLAHLTKLFEEQTALLAAKTEDNENGKGKDSLPDGMIEVKIEGKPEQEYDIETAKRRLDNIEKACRAADKSVKMLEYWSDVKDMVEEGDTLGAVDENAGWDAQKWAGVDNSGPKDVVSDPVVGKDANLLDGGRLEKKVSFAADASPAQRVDKGKAKEVFTPEEEEKVPPVEAVKEKVEKKVDEVKDNVAPSSGKSENILPEKDNKPPVEAVEHKVEQVKENDGSSSENAQNGFAGKENLPPGETAVQKEVDEGKEEEIAS